jgi:acyl carrier protein
VELRGMKTLRVPQNHEGTHPMQSYEDILAQLYEILKPLVPSGRTLQEDTDLVNDLDLDSMRVMKLLLAVEDSFDISIPLNILPHVRTVKDFASQVQQLTGEGQ